MSEQAEVVQEEPASKSGKIKIIIKGALIILLIVGAEVIAAAYFLPSGHDTETLARELAAAKAGESGPAHAGAVEESTQSSEPLTEFELGTFNVTKYNPETEKTLVIDFELYAAVPTAEGDEFHEQLESNRNRLREQIIITVHASETADLTEAGLGLIKRKILEKTNRALGKPLAREILLSKFNFVER